MHVRSYTIHWRRLWTLGAAFVGWTWQQDWRSTWIQFNLWIILALLISIRRERQGLVDEWSQRY